MTAPAAKCVKGRARTRQFGRFNPRLLTAACINPAFEAEENSLRTSGNSVRRAVRKATDVVPLRSLAANGVNNISRI